MGRNKLTEAEVQIRLQEGRNYKRLYFEMKTSRDELKAENIKLKAEIRTLQDQLATQAIQIAELQTMVFGRKKKPPNSGSPKDNQLKPEPKTRGSKSYRRPTPLKTAITTEVAVPLPEQCSCGGCFESSTITMHDRYIEDIPLPNLTENYQAHLVTKYVIARGICSACGKATASQDLGGAEVALGPNVRLLITHLITIVGLSYSQTTSLLLGLYGLSVSGGEIANILRKQHQLWLPAYEQLKADIRAAPITHYDETPWKIQQSDNTGYAWVMSAAGSPKTAFHLTTSRGTRHARDLHADTQEDSVHITDDYAPYRNLVGQQQLCWAHPYRNARDLDTNHNVPDEQKEYVHEWYEDFKDIYKILRIYLDQPYDKTTRMTQATELWESIQAIANKPAPKAGEPDKLRRLKAQLLRAGKDRWFTCLLKDTPCDNNRAERDIRPLVLKRKRSFGSQTEQGAKALSTVLSICTTTWRSNPEGYFKALASVGV